MASTLVLVSHLCLLVHALVRLFAYLLVLASAVPKAAQGGDGGDGYASPDTSQRSTMHFHDRAAATHTYL